MRRKWIGICLVLVMLLFVCCACTKESPEKPEASGNDSKFAVNQAESGQEESSSGQESSVQESSEVSSKPEETSDGAAGEDGDGV